MSAVKKLPGSPTYAAIYTSNHVHLPRSSHMRSESLRSVNNPGMEVFRATRQNNDDNSDDEHVKCAKVSYHFHAKIFLWGEVFMVTQCTPATSSL